MRYAAPLKFDLTPYEAPAASLRDWLGHLTLWLVRLFAPSKCASAKTKRETIADLRETAWEVRRILLMQAVARVTAHKGPVARSTHQPARALPNRSKLRALIGNALPDLNAGTLDERAARLQQILDNPEPYIARIVARLCRVCGCVRIMRPIRQRSANAPAPATHALNPRYADSS